MTRKELLSFAWMGQRGSGGMSQTQKGKRCLPRLRCIKTSPAARPEQDGCHRRLGQGMGRCRSEGTNLQLKGEDVLGSDASMGPVVSNTFLCT